MFIDDVQISRFSELLSVYTDQSSRRVNFAALSAAVGRNIQDTIRLANSLRQRSSPAEFTKDEDDFILSQGAHQYRGIWTRIGLKLNRHPAIVRARYSRLKRKQEQYGLDENSEIVTALDWSPEMVSTAGDSPWYR
jgi:hypothetical protein